MDRPYDWGLSSYLVGHYEGHASLEGLCHWGHLSQMAILGYDLEYENCSLLY